MKIIIILICFLIDIDANTIKCAISNTANSAIKKIFKEKISYSNLDVKTIVSQNILEDLRTQKNIKFAIIRRDILWQQHENNSTVKNSYITISELPYYEQLFMIQQKDELDLEIDMLVTKRISIGSLSRHNVYYLKKLLDQYRVKYQVFYKSYTYKKSLKALDNHTIDVYFTFLPPSYESSKYHFQTLFSDTTLKYFEHTKVFKIDYNGIFSPYVLIASKEADDEEIENIIYRLMDKNIFSPLTDERFGTVNRYVMRHLSAVKYALEKKKLLLNVKKNGNLYSDKICRKYHYGFLKLLRQKPKLKKKIVQLNNAIKIKSFLHDINKVLLDIDSVKDECDLTFLSKEKIKFNKIKNNINYSIEHQ